MAIGGDLTGLLGPQTKQQGRPIDLMNTIMMDIKTGACENK